MRIAIACLLTLTCLAPLATAAEQPNILLIMTDDQGFGDLGVQGNPIIKTPNIDRLAGESASVEHFYVSPVCAPTRASLMTGRWNYRTGVVDTYRGRAMMHPDEVTVAEVLSKAGYRTGIFGKWHLGDSYPMRPQDQGFQEVLMHSGGGLCQPSGPLGNSYFDPSLLYNGKRIKTEGYCSDVYVDYALRFIDSDADRPWFVYLPFNCPHGPFQIADEYAAPYEQLNMKPDDFPQTDGGHPTGRLSGNTAKVYGMVENIDENVGRMLAKLDELGQRENTIVVFLHDNGANGNRYDCGLKAHKGSVYEGGIRSFFFVRWPARLKAGHVVRRIAAHVDVPPTLLDAAGVEPPADVAIDGRSLLPLLEGRAVEWPERTLFLQWHRGDRPERYRACAARSQDYKIVQPGSGSDFELYDMRRDPFETRNVAAEHPEVVKRLKAEYDTWFNSVSNERSGFAPPRIVVGTEHENPVVLTRQDWRVPADQRGWGRCGHWELSVPESGTFVAECLLSHPTKHDVTATLTVQDVEQAIDVAPGTKRFKFKPVELDANGAMRLQVGIRRQKQDKPQGPYHVFLERVE